MTNLEATGLGTDRTTNSAVCNVIRRSENVVSGTAVHVNTFPLLQCNTHINYIRESVDSLCRDGADTPMPPYIGKAFTRTNFEDLSLFR